MLKTERFIELSEHHAELQAALRTWDKGARNDMLFIASCVMMTYALMSPPSPTTDDASSSNHDYFTQILALILIACAGLYYIFSRSRHRLMREMRTTSTDDMWLIRNERKICELHASVERWMEDNRTTRNIMDDYVQPAILVGNIAAAYATWGEAGLTLVGTVMFSLRVAEENPKRGHKRAHELVL